MIYKTEINPRDFKGFHDMMGHLQDDCMRLHGANFNVLKVAMGQIQHFSEIFWFEGYVDDAEIEKAKRMQPRPVTEITAFEFVADNVTDGKVDYKLAVEAIRADRDGRFADSPKQLPVVNIHVASLGTFNIRQSNAEDLAEMKSQLTRVIVDAINEFQHG